MESPSQVPNISLPVIRGLEQGGTEEFAIEYPPPGPLAPSEDFINQGICHILLKG